uniref:MFS domain-containing protein n=1 Tax=Macrostomum lignano TaxID=282301 RepID=A0A1I8GV19_9PLAT
VRDAYRVTDVWSLSNDRPIAGALVNKFGCRPVCIAGAVLATAAFVISSFAPSLAVLTFSYGILGGIGFGLIYLPSMVCVNFYFEEYRALAMGLAVCGTGIGTMVMGPLTRALAEEFGWRNCLLILGGIVFNSAVFALMKPNEPEPVQQRRRRTSPRDAAARRVERGRRPDDTDEAAACRELVASTVSVRKMSTSTEGGSVGAVLRSLPALVDHRTKIPAGSASNRCKVAKAARARQFDVKAVCDDPIATAAIEDFKRPLYRKDIFYAGSVASLASSRIRKKSAVTPSQLVISMTRIPGEMSTQGSVRTIAKPEKMPDGEESEDETAAWVPKPIRDAFLLMTDLSLLKDSGFLIAWIANLVSMLSFYIPLFFIGDFAREAGVSDGESRYLNAAFGSANTLSRILVGWAAGNPKVSPLLVNNVSLFFSAVLVLVLNYSTSFPMLIATYTALGVTLGPFITLTSEILCRLVGLDNLTSAFGLIILARGISTCVGSPLAASLYSPSTKYLLPFAVGGGLFALSSVIFSILLLPRFSQRQEANKSELQETMRSVQNLHASFLLVEGTQLVTSN